MKTIIRSIVIASTLVASSVFAQSLTTETSNLCMRTIDAAFHLKDLGESKSGAKLRMMIEVDKKISDMETRRPFYRVITTTVDIVYNGNVSRNELKKACL